MHVLHFLFLIWELTMPSRLALNSWTCDPDPSTSFPPVAETIGAGYSLYLATLGWFLIALAKIIISTFSTYVSLFRLEIGSQEAHPKLRWIKLSSIFSLRTAPLLSHASGDGLQKSNILIVWSLSLNYINILQALFHQAWD